MEDDSELGVEIEANKLYNLSESHSLECIKCSFDEIDLEKDLYPLTCEGEESTSKEIEVSVDQADFLASLGPDDRRAFDWQLPLWQRVLTRSRSPRQSDTKQVGMIKDVKYGPIGAVIKTKKPVSNAAAAEPVADKTPNKTTKNAADAKGTWLNRVKTNYTTPTVKSQKNNVRNHDINKTVPNAIRGTNIKRSHTGDSFKNRMANGDQKKISAWRQRACSPAKQPAKGTKPNLKTMKPGGDAKEHVTPQNEKIPSPTAQVEEKNQVETQPDAEKLSDEKTCCENSAKVTPAVEQSSPEVPHSEKKTVEKITKNTEKETAIIDASPQKSGSRGEKCEKTEAKTRRMPTQKAETGGQRVNVRRNYHKTYGPNKSITKVAQPKLTWQELYLRTQKEMKEKKVEMPVISEEEHTSENESPRPCSKANTNEKCDDEKLDDICQQSFQSPPPICLASNSSETKINRITSPDSPTITSSETKIITLQADTPSVKSSDTKVSVGKVASNQLNKSAKKVSSVRSVPSRRKSSSSKTSISRKSSRSSQTSTSKLQGFSMKKKTKDSKASIFSDKPKSRKSIQSKISKEKILDIKEFDENKIEHIKSTDNNEPLELNETFNNSPIKVNSDIFPPSEQNKEYDFDEIINNAEKIRNLLSKKNSTENEFLTAQNLSYDDNWFLENAYHSDDVESSDSEKWEERGLDIGDFFRPCFFNNFHTNKNETTKKDLLKQDKCAIKKGLLEDHSKRKDDSDSAASISPLNSFGSSYKSALSSSEPVTPFGTPKSSPSKEDKEDFTSSCVITGHSTIPRLPEESSTSIGSSSIEKAIENYFIENVLQGNVSNKLPENNLQGGKYISTSKEKFRIHGKKKISDGKILGCYRRETKPTDIRRDRINKVPLSTVGQSGQESGWARKKCDYLRQDKAKRSLIPQVANRAGKENIQRPFSRDSSRESALKWNTGNPDHGWRPRETTRPPEKCPELISHNGGTGESDGRRPATSHMSSRAPSFQQKQRPAKTKPEPKKLSQYAVLTRVATAPHNQRSPANIANKYERVTQSKIAGAYKNKNKQRCCDQEERKASGQSCTPEISMSSSIQRPPEIENSDVFT